MLSQWWVGAEYAIKTGMTLASLWVQFEVRVGRSWCGLVLDKTCGMGEREVSRTILDFWPEHLEEYLSSFFSLFYWKYKSAANLDCRLSPRTLVPHWPHHLVNCSITRCSASASALTFPVTRGLIQNTIWVMLYPWLKTLQLASRFTYTKAKFLLMAK